MGRSWEGWESGRSGRVGREKEGGGLVKRGVGGRNGRKWDEEGKGRGSGKGERGMRVRSRSVGRG